MFGCNECEYSTQYEEKLWKHEEIDHKEEEVKAGSIKIERKKEKKREKVKRQREREREKKAKVKK